MDELKKLLAEATKAGLLPLTVALDQSERWAVILDPMRQGLVRVVNSTPCFDPEEAALIVAAVNALPELVAIKAERDRAQRACEQMGARITSLEAALKPFSDKAHYWLERDDIHGLDDDDECATEIRFGDLRRARAALNQEPGS